jgi:hypothetical protein
MQTRGDTIVGMKDKVEALLKQRHGWLTLADIVKLQLIPWARDARTVRKLIDADAMGKNVLKAKVDGKSTQRRYLVRSTALTRYIEIYGPAMMGTVRKTKHGKHSKIRK